MLTRFLTNPNHGDATLRHNSSLWQVTELMGGLACELLLKERSVEPWQQKSDKLELHACYPSVFMQGDAATHFLAELEEAQRTCSNAEIDRLFLAEYRNTLN